MRDYRTDFEKTTEERNKNISTEYRKRRKESPDTTRSRIIGDLANQFQLNPQTIRTILIKLNVY